jgi:hypothetical protein
MMSKVFNIVKLPPWKVAAWATLSPRCIRRGAHCGMLFPHKQDR